jgi:N-acetylglucosamine-6-phosphate deacetylase
MRPLDHRSPSILAAALTDPRICADLICDGVHVDPVMVDLFLRAKGPDNAILISDALSPTGMPPGRYQLGGMVVEVAGNVCMHGGTLAGSVLTLDRAVRNAMKFARWDLQSALRLATINPARQLRLLRESGTNSASAALGVLAPGSRADIVALSPAGDVLATFIGGELV